MPSSRRQGVSTRVQGGRYFLADLADGRGAVSYQFAQVGNDVKGTVQLDSACSAYRSAQKFLSSLDDHPQIGNLIDQVMDFEYEQEQMMTSTGLQLSPEMWLMK